jgi:hypothetical protein
MKQIIVMILLPIYIFGIDILYKPKLITKLDNIKLGNVIQGISYIDNLWFFSQTKNNKVLVLTILNSKFDLLANATIPIKSHGQDLTIIKNKNLYYLYTTGKNWNGIYRLTFNSSFRLLSKYKHIRLNIGKNTPTATDKYYISVAHKNIYIFDKENTKFAKYSFVLNSTQMPKNQWIQGITIKNNYIFVLTGNNKISDNKYLVIYNLLGDTIKTIKLDIGKALASREGSKWELEGLAFKNNKLYTTVMTGHDGHNKKRLYQILKVLYD